MILMIWIGIAVWATIPTSCFSSMSGFFGALSGLLTTVPPMASTQTAVVPAESVHSCRSRLSLTVLVSWAEAAENAQSNGNSQAILIVLTTSLQNLRVARDFER